MQRLWLVSCVVASGCSGTIDASASLRVEPETIDLTVDLASPAPTAALQVLLVHADSSVDDVTTTASFELDGAPLGELVGASLVSDGFTGGSATIHISCGDLATSIQATAHVYSRRVVDGTPAGAADAFATATATPFDAHLDPQDGAVIPPGLGRMVLSFAANDLDDTHQVTVTAPYLDLAFVAPGVAGPRELELSASEVGAITHTARGGAVELDVASLQSTAPATSRVTTVGLEIADLDASSLLISGIAAAGAITDADHPALWRYDMQAGGAAAMFTTPNGVCIGCHLAVSADGARIGALTNATTSPFLSGLILDAHSGAVLAQSDPTSASPWATAAFDPSGALLAAWQGALSLRDSTTGAVIGQIATADSAAAPTIAPDGSAVAYVSFDAGGSSEPVGNALRMRSWNAAQLAVGPPVELVRDGDGVVLPEFSSDGRWVAFGHSLMLPNESGDVPASSSAVRTDGSGTMVMLTADPLDQLAHWASPIASARVGNRAAEPMVWIAINSTRAVGGNATNVTQLWLEAFYPDRGVVAPAFHLPGQPATLQVLHGPIALPD
jgi:hypothetical protein